MNTLNRRLKQSTFLETYYIFYYSTFLARVWKASKLLSRLEAAIGIEPMDKGFAEIYQHGLQRTMEV